ncbi:MAG: VanZ family protein [Anaerotruncus sp.]|nr:VanZ family protein [Anaerotruncus sp.]
MNIKIFINTFINSGKQLAEQFVFWPLIIVCVIMLIILISDFRKRASGSLNFFEFAGTPGNEKRYLSIMALLLLFAIVLNATLFSRIGVYHITHPLAYLWAGWNPFVSDLNPTWNTIAFMPLGTVIYSYAKNVRGTKMRSRACILISTLAAFATSLFIETTQLIFKIGTFQISDLFYNTLGGLLGALIFVAIRKLRRKIKYIDPSKKQ